MRISVKLFAAEAQALGRREAVVQIDAGQPTCAAVRRGLAAQYPPLADRLGRCRLAVNHEFAPDDRVIHSGDEVALIGAVSGG